MVIQTDGRFQVRMIEYDTQQIQIFNIAKTAGENNYTFMYSFPLFSSAQVQQCPLLLISCYSSSSPDVRLDVLLSRHCLIQLRSHSSCN